MSTTIPVRKFWRVPFDATTADRVHGEVRILEERCKGCSYCVEFCPRGVLSRSERFNLKGYHPPDVHTADDCAACRLCELICPDFAIRVEERTRTEVRHAG